MKILVVAATSMEIASFIATNKTATILITGVGVPACMYALTKHLQHNTYNFLIQAGIAGTFKKEFVLGETYCVKTEQFADLGMVENNIFFTLFEKGFANENEMPYKNGILINSTENFFGLNIANAITVNTVTDNVLQTTIFNKQDADIESMEGAAFHYVCITEGIAFLQIRSISNNIGERAKINWKMQEAIASLNENLIKIVDQLNGRL